MAKRCECAGHLGALDIFSTRDISHNGQSNYDDLHPGGAVTMCSRVVSVSYIYVLKTFQYYILSSKRVDTIVVICTKVPQLNLFRLGGTYLRIGGSIGPTELPLLCTALNHITSQYTSWAGIIIMLKINIKHQC